MWYIGVESINGQLEKDIVKAVYQSKDIKVEDYPEGVFVQYRDGFWVAVNYSSENYKLILDEQTNVLIGEKIVPPAGVTIWVE